MRSGFIPWLCCLGVGLAAVACSPIIKKAYDNRPWMAYPGTVLDSDPDKKPFTLTYQPEDYRLLAAFYLTLSIGSVAAIIGAIGLFIEYRQGLPTATIARGFEVRRKNE